ncbi:MAG: hypothetical protein ACE5MH_10810, partial [Terriglobia bacterium]
MKFHHAFFPLVGSLEEMLGQTLERLLAELRVQLGTIAVLGRDRQPNEYIHRGLPESLLRDLERRGLLVHLHHLVARLGGLLVIPNLTRKPPLTLLAAEAMGFEQLLNRAQQEGVQAL